VVPRLRCRSSDQEIAATVGVVGHIADLVFPPNEAGLFIGCEGGTAHYRPALMVYGHSTSYPADVAHAGETIVLRVSMSRHGVYVVTRVSFRSIHNGRPALPRSAIAFAS
jgi:hypothetical protein